MGLDNISPDVQILGTDLSPVGEYIHYVSYVAEELYLHCYGSVGVCLFFRHCEHDRE